MEENTGEMVLGRLDSAGRIDYCTELPDEFCGIQRRRAEEVQQRSEVQIEEPKPSHSEVVDDHSQPVERLETLLVCSGKRCVVAEKDQPAGAPERRQIFLIEQRAKVPDEIPRIAEITG